MKTKKDARPVLTARITKLLIKPMVTIIDAQGRDVAECEGSVLTFYAGALVDFHQLIEKLNAKLNADPAHLAQLREDARPKLDG